MTNKIQTIINSQEHTDLTVSQKCPTSNLQPPAHTTKNYAFSNWHVMTQKFMLNSKRIWGLILCNWKDRHILSEIKSLPHHYEKNNENKQHISHSCQHSAFPGMWEMPFSSVVAAMLLPSTFQKKVQESSLRNRIRSHTLANALDTDVFQTEATRLFLTAYSPPWSTNRLLFFPKDGNQRKTPQQRKGSINSHMFCEIFPPHRDRGKKSWQLTAHMEACFFSFFFFVLWSSFTELDLFLKKTEKGLEERTYIKSNNTLSPTPGYRIYTKQPAKYHVFFQTYC